MVVWFGPNLEMRFLTIAEKLNGRVSAEERLRLRAQPPPPTTAA